MINEGSPVFIAPPGTSPFDLDGWSYLGEVVEGSVTRDRYSSPRYTITAVLPASRFFEDIQVSADRNQAERIAREDPGAAGW